MKVLVLHRYFWPQRYPYALMLRHIVEKLATQFTVSILTTETGSQKEIQLRSEWSKKQNVDINSLSLGSEKQAGVMRKIFNSLYFGVWVFYRLSVSRADVIMVATTPPIVIATIVRWVSDYRGTKYIYHCQDIHPEAMLLGGRINKGLLYQLLLSLDKKNINSAWKVITLSTDMKKSLEQRGCDTSHVNIINNFIFETSYNFVPRQENEDVIHFLFSGSLGRLQNLDVLMDSIVLLRHRMDIKFTFMGGGVMYKEMIRRKKENDLSNIEFLGQRGIEEAVDAMQSAHIGIVSLASSISTVAYPSKTIMYLGNGLPVLALVDEDSDIYNFINDENMGLAISPKSPEQIAKSIAQLSDKLMNHPFNRLEVRDKAQLYFGKDVILPKYLEVYS